MFNARITWAAFDYREPTSQSNSKTGRQHNASRFEKLISGLQLRNSGVSPSGSKTTQFQVKWARTEHDDVVSFLRSLQWSSKTNPIQAELEFVGRKLAPVDSWLVIAPQVKQSAAGSWQVQGEEFKCVARSRTGERFGVFSSPEHLNFAKWLVGDTDRTYDSPVKPRQRTGVLLVYPTRELLDDNKVAVGIPVIGFGIVLPRPDGLRQRIAYSV